MESETKVSPRTRRAREQRAFEKAHDGAGARATKAIQKWKKLGRDGKRGVVDFIRQSVNDTARCAVPQDIHFAKSLEIVADLLEALK